MTRYVGSRDLLTGCPRSADEHGDEIEHEADEAAHQRAVDADELQVAADLDLDLSRSVGRVPALYRPGDELGDLGPILIYHAEDQSFQRIVDVLQELLAGQCPLGDPGER